ncbi:MAG TPA: protein-disulfide reductase DsbD domain-containing protein, partial [Stellaceae bacterium]|nr:protein-disulfide reductase DsbD domain-containing protein [Stellaceae bacterium]
PLGLLCLAACLLLGPAVAASAAEPASAWFTTQQGRVRLIAAEPTVGSVEQARLGLQFELAPGWKIYWRSPGDAGFPPQLDWKGSENVASAEIAWPAPMRFSVLGLETVGYEDAVVLPIAVKLAKPGAPLHAEVGLNYLTCEKICIPYETTLTLDLPAGAADASGGFAQVIADYQAKVPGDGKGAGLHLDSAGVETGEKPHLLLRLSASPPLAHPDAFVEGPAGLGFGMPELIGDRARPELRIPIYGDGKTPPRIAGERLVVTVVDGSRALEAIAVPSEEAPPAPLPSLLSVLLLALIGGFILNFMPCVLPVLSLKLLAAVGHGESRAELRRGFLATAVGILLSFFVLAGTMVAVRSAGMAVGWGAQFQQPPFLAAMAALTTLFAANLWGWFEISLPRFLADRARLVPGRPSLLGSVAAGALATLLATPCSAPLLGTAVGFALAGSSLDILAIFAALGLGLALPYLAVATVPALARLLPRPGHWMLTLRRILGLALLGTSAWLVFVLVAEAGPLAATLVGAFLAALLVLLGSARASRFRAVAAILAIAAALGSVMALPPPQSAPGRLADALWQPFDRTRIAGLVGEGKVVFVDVTADWCVNCKFNRWLVLDRSPVRERLAAPGTVAMIADWTRPDAAIAAYLMSYGRYGIPFNAVYGPGAPGGIALSELLSTEDVLRAIERAQGSARAADNITPPPGG